MANSSMFSVRPNTTHSIPRKPLPLPAAVEVKTETVISTPGGHSSNKLCTSQTTASTSFFGVWWLELVSCVVAVGTLSAIVGILYPLQHRPLPSLPFRISVNSLISFLVTLMKACVLLALTEGLGQLKWEHFRKRRPVKHFVVYDSATRGPMGCFELISMSRKHNLVAAVGAAVTILAIIVDPFTQQLVHYYPCNLSTTNGSVASIPRSSYYNEADFTPGSTPLATTAQVGMVVGAIFNPDLARIPFLCETGNCWFNHTYATLGFCVECQDVTNELKFKPYNATFAGTLTDEYLNTSLPSGLWATSDLDDAQFSVRTAADFSTAAEVSVEAVFAKTSPPDVVWANSQYFHDGCNLPWQQQKWGCTGPGATRCKINPCVKTYRAQIEAGRLKETLLNTYNAWFKGLTNDSSTPTSFISMADLECLDNDAKSYLRERGYEISGPRFIPYNVTIDYNNNLVPLNIPPDGYNWKTDNITWPTPADRALNLFPKSCIYTISSATTGALSNWMSTYLTFNASLGVHWDSNVLGVKMLNNSYVNSKDIEMTLTSVTEGLSALARQYKYNGTDVYSVAAKGSTMVVETCLEVRWAWIAYPAVITFATLGFFAAVLFSTASTRDGGFARGWKSSPLPLIYHGMDGMSDESDAVGKKMDDIRDMDGAAKVDTCYVAGEAGDRATGLLRP